MALMVSILAVVSACKTHKDTASEPPAVLQEFPETGIFFQDTVVTGDSLHCEGRILPALYRLMKADYPRLRTYLLSVHYPAKGEAPDTILLAVPTPDGAFGIYRIFPSTVMAPELAARYPEIRTFSGNSVDRPSEQIRLEITPLGITAMILTENGSVMIDPFCKGVSDLILVYHKKDLPPGAKQPFEK